MDLSYISPSGEVLELTPRVGDGVVLKRGGVSGLVASPSRAGLSSVLFPGQVVGDTVVGPMTGSLTVGLCGDVAGWWARLLDVWSVHDAGTLELATSVGRFWCRARLSAPLSAPASDMSRSRLVDGVQIPVIVDEGVWWSGPESGTGTVTVTNHGDTMTYPSIGWVGAGGPVTLPSGTSFVLPATSDDRRLRLSDAESLAVVDDDGNLDRTLWPIAGAVAEGIPRGGTRTYLLPPGATLYAPIAHFNPWR